MAKILKKGTKRIYIKRRGWGCGDGGGEASSLVSLSTF